jgi:hypothetical protein
LTPKVIIETPPQQAFQREMEAIAAVVRSAIYAAVKGAGAGLKIDFRREITSALGPRAARSMDVRVFPENKESADAAAVVAGRGDAADRFLAGHSLGGVRTPRKARLMAIPLHNERNGAAKTLLSPSEIRDRYNQDLEFIPAKKQGQGVGLLVLRNVVISSRSRRLRLATRIRRARGDQVVIKPMFLLVREVRAKRVLYPERIMQAWQDLMPDLVNEALDAIERSVR